MASGNRGPSGRCSGRKQNCETCKKHGPTKDGKCWECREKAKAEHRALEEDAMHEMDDEKVTTMNKTIWKAAEAEAKRYREALKKIIAQQTKYLNATVSRIVKIATDALN